ncbi:hypothetical protein KC19_VG178200 [Ceratodon purpureus]|uniref:Uncharacterized protein n=1 Tax=Ceratodon purpureus TaxID=3225 RepID=A0A8T0HRS9_CERPU|nr:hypothetical protein KC19_VG178200 [Ceratodon purpureus]
MRHQNVSAPANGCPEEVNALADPPKMPKVPPIRPTSDGAREEERVCAGEVPITACAVVKDTIAEPAPKVRKSSRPSKKKVRQY